MIFKAYWLNILWKINLNLKLNVSEFFKHTQIFQIRYRNLWKFSNHIRPSDLFANKIFNPPTNFTSCKQTNAKGEKFLKTYNFLLSFFIIQTRINFIHEFLFTLWQLMWRDTKDFFHHAIARNSLALSSRYGLFKIS